MGTGCLKVNQGQYRKQLRQGQHVQRDCASQLGTAVSLHGGSWVIGLDPLFSFIRRKVVGAHAKVPGSRMMTAGTSSTRDMGAM